MTDTGQVPGEGQPENAGGRLGQPHPADVHAPPADAGYIEQPQPGAPQGAPYTYLDAHETVGEEDDLLLMPGAQGAWSEQQAQYQSGVYEAGVLDPATPGYADTQMPEPQPMAAQPLPQQAPPSAPARRPLHMGPPVPDTSNGVVRSLADRGPAAGRHAAPVRQAEAPAAEPQPQPAAEPQPEGAPQAGPEYVAGPEYPAAAEYAPGADYGAAPEYAAGPQYFAAQPEYPGPLPGPQFANVPQIVEAPPAGAAWDTHPQAQPELAPVPAPEETVGLAEDPAPPETPAEAVPGPQPFPQPEAADGGVPAEAAASAAPAEPEAPEAQPVTMEPGPVDPAAADLAQAGATIPAQAGAPVMTDAPAVDIPAQAQQPGPAPGQQDAQPAPVAEPTPEIPAQMSHEPIAHPVAAAPEPVAAEPEPVAEAPEPVAEAPEPVAAEPEPVAEEPEPVAEEATPEEQPAEEPVTAEESDVPAAEVPAPAPVEEAPQQTDERPVESAEPIAADPGHSIVADETPQPMVAPEAPEASGEPEAEAAPEAPAPEEAVQAEAVEDAPQEQAAAEPEAEAAPEPEADAEAPEPEAPETAEAEAEEETAEPVTPQEETPEPVASEEEAPAAEAAPEEEAPTNETTEDQSAAPEAETPEAEAADLETAETPDAEAAEPAEPEAEAEPTDPDGEHHPDTEFTDAEAEAEPAPVLPADPPAEAYDDAERAAVHRVMRERRDIRNGFRSDPIPHEVLLRVLEAAHTAPSVGHSQPWDFVVIRSEETRRAMHELAMRQRDAYAKSLPKGRAKQFKELKIEAILETPVNIVVTADPTRGGRHTLGRHTQPQMAPYSSALAVENLWLAARAEGLGVGWVSFFDEREMVRELGLPEHLEVVAYLCVGYVDEFPKEPELMRSGWSKRRPLAWVVHEETYGRRALPGEDPHNLLQETLQGIRPLDAKALGEAWERQKRMTKPSGALGMLEIISAQLSGLSRQCPPPIPEPAAVAIFAGDHGVHAQGVTAWPQEVTSQMVANFLGGGAVCNAFASQVGAEVCVVDVGVASELPSTPGLLPRKVRAGTGDFATGPALTREEVLRAIEVGIETARDLVAAGNKALLSGEMGIANTTVSAALVSVYTGADPAEVTGRGTGINDEMHARKIDVVRRGLELHQPDPADPIGVLAAFGGLEHAAIVGLLLGGASLRTPVILDGVSAGAAALVARAIAPEVLAACIAGHRSAEPGHVAALNKLGLRPLVDLDLRLGEGTGALLALPVVQSAARAMHEVATFDSAGVTEKN
ncbi:nicotinate-nucleotide--dimethylbenzimidazole phosphoribosyltransferase [Streptomyces sp. NPDC005271]|uniref:nicotinate-nucleotide--dimethylbenzimidazole phosphoribosyltransferase n=1 Tax=unclassified Streptomyces TaxID=2593676 RepID=UPI0033B44612